MKLLERDGHLEALAAYLDDAKRGEGRLVMIGGEAGIGKTALVDAFAERARPGPWSRSAPATACSPREPLEPFTTSAERSAARWEMR